MTEVLKQFPLLIGDHNVAYWLQLNAARGLVSNTLLKYAYTLSDYVRFCKGIQIDYLNVTPEHTSRYQRELKERAWRRGHATYVGLSAATIRQRMVVLKLYYEHLKEEGLRTSVPIRKRSWIHDGTQVSGIRYGSVDTGEAFWIPNDVEWRAIVAKIETTSLRNLVMLHFAYEAALRREELCSLQVGDIDQVNRLITVRGETTKNKMSRTVPYSEATQQLYVQHLSLRPLPKHPQERVFLSESRRNAGMPISIWTWSKVIRFIGLRVGLPELTTHTMRHLRLTHLAEAGIDLHTIAKFAGHKNIQTTMRYIHTRPSQLAKKVAAAMLIIHRTCGSDLH